MGLSVVLDIVMWEFPEIRVHVWELPIMMSMVYFNNRH